jgi:hypothetical protein
MFMRRPALVLALALCGALAAPALAHEGNPDFESLVTAVEGAPGVKAEILNGDDRLLVVNEGSSTVVVEGYDSEPYARLRPDGTVEVNRRSEATYLNEDRFGDVPLPAAVDNRAAPRWKVVGRNGRFEFHDHRMHWMSKTDPPQVRSDRSARQRVFDWTVPLRVGERGSGAIRGTLWWRGDGGGAPVAMFAGLGAFALVALGFVLVVRRRRSSSAGSEAEAW